LGSRPCTPLLMFANESHLETDKLYSNLKLRENGENNATLYLFKKKKINMSETE